MEAFASKFASTTGSGLNDSDPFGEFGTAVDVGGGFGEENFQNDSMNYLSEVIPITQVIFF